MDPNTNVALSIKNCTFSYFFKDYEALIYVENNNMMIQNLTARLYPLHEPNLMIFSDDRGATINITDNSYFEHSRFEKGMIVYEGLPNMHSSDLNTVINLGREFWDRPSSVPKTKSKAMINVKDSFFDNLAMGLSVDKLSYG